MSDHSKARFIAHMMAQMLGCDPSMDVDTAMLAAKAALEAFCEDEGCEFGDPRFIWTQEGAVDVIHAYETHHWESAP